MSFKSIHQFEELIADFFGSPYAVSTDSCTHALELVLRYHNTKSCVCPFRTYISVPSTLEKLNINWTFVNNHWHNYYYLTDNLIDAAVLWQANSYIKDTLMCVSFQYQKHLGLGRGGIILLDKKEDYNALSKMRYDGRDLDTPWADQDIQMLGYHYYMTPETALQGIKRFRSVKDVPAREWSFRDYPDLSKMSLFAE